MSRTVVGREHELALLEAAADRAERGATGTMVLVEGAAGEGKSSLVERVLAVCRDRNVAVVTIKSIARRPWWGCEHTRTTRYEPFEEQGNIDAAVHWVLARPGFSWRR